MSRRTVLALGLTLFLAACNNPVGPSDIVGDTWQLTSFQTTGSEPVMIDDSASYTVQFGEDGQLSVTSDCNGCEGSYTLSGSSLEVSALTCTQVLCPQPSLGAEFTAALQGAQVISFDDEVMVIQGGGVTMRFRN